MHLTIIHVCVAHHVHARRQLPPQMYMHTRKVCASCTHQGAPNIERWCLECLGGPATCISLPGQKIALHGLEDVLQLLFACAFVCTGAGGKAVKRCTHGNIEPGAVLLQSLCYERQWLFGRSCLLSLAPTWFFTAEPHSTHSVHTRFAAHITPSHIYMQTGGHASERASEGETHVLRRTCKRTDHPL